MINIGIIGSGYIAQTHASSVKQIKNAKLMGVAGGKRTQEFSKKYNIKIYESIDALLDDNNLDAIIIASPHGAHKEQTIKAASKGKHVLVEKPMSLNVEESQAMIKASETYNIKLMVDQSQRYFPTNKCVYDLLREGVYGKPLIIRSCQMGAGLELRELPLKHWALDDKLGGIGTTLGYGIHNIDKVLWWTNQIPTFIFGSYRSDWISKNKENSSFIHFKTKEGTDVNLWFQGSFSGKIFDYQKDCAEIICERGHIECQTYRKVRICKEGGDWKTVLELDFRKERSNIYQSVVQDFINSIVNNTQPLVTGYDGLKSIKMVEKSYESHLKEAIVKW